MLYDMVNSKSIRITFEDRCVLESVRQTASKPLKGKTSDTIMIKLGEKYVMINGIKSFGKIDEKTNCRRFVDECIINAIHKFNDSHVSGVVRPEAELLIRKNMKTREEARKTNKHKTLKNFREAGQDGNGPIIVDVLPITLFKYRNNLSDLKAARDS